MRYLLLMVLYLQSLYGVEHRLLLSGFTRHETRYNTYGEKFNEENWGLGYEYSTFELFEELYYSTNVTILKDSFNAEQYTLSSAPSIRYQMAKHHAYSFGLAFFLMWKEENYIRQTPGSDIDYGFIPGMAPIVSYYYKDLTFNIAYVPTVHIGNIENTGFAILYFGWTF